MISSEQILTNFIQSYLQTAEWIEFDSPDKNKGYSKEAKITATDDCKKFIELVETTFPNEAEAILTHQGNDVTCLAGHEFYLTRNRHGVGFWDRDIWNELAPNGCDRLTTIAQSMREAHLYKGAGGYLYFD